MADIATIGFKADTSGLDAAKQKLEALPAAAASAERATDKLDRTLETLSKAAGDMARSADALTKASERLANAHKSTASNSNDAKSATDKLNSSYDKSVDAANKAASASKKLEDQVSKTAAATVNASNTALRSLKDEAAARLAAERAAGKTYDAGIVPRVPGARNGLGGINVPKITDADRAASAANLAARAAGLNAVTVATTKASAANDNLKDGIEETGKTVTKTSDGFGRFARGLAAAFTINKLVDFAKESVQSLVQLGDTSKRTGIELQRLQELQYAGVQKGLSRDQFNTGVEGLAEKLNEASHIETTLSKLFDDNNIKLKDRTGQVMSTNDALMRASGLIQNAATEFDKIKIAEALGLTREWIPLLEQGPDAINKMAEAAGGLGTIFDREAIEKARKFNEEWSSAVDRWVQMFKTAAMAVLGFLDWIISKAQGLFSALDGYAKQVLANEDLKNNGAGGASRSTVDYMIKRAQDENSELDKTVLERKNVLDQMDAENERYGKVDTFAQNAVSNALQVTVRKGRTTNVSSLFDKGGGGGGGADEKDDFETIVTRAEVRIQKLQAERDAIGLNAEAAARLKYETDLLGQAKKADIDLTDEQRQKLMGLADQMATTEVSTKQLKDALDFGKDLTKGFLQDFLNGVKNGESVFQSFGKAALGVLNKISDKLISMAVDSLFSKGGSGGGIFGSFFKFLLPTASALGDAFTGSGKVTAFANGGAFTNGLYSRPTLFQYANGGAFGVMGEAGPEAVMPLKRGPDGSLGVQMHNDNAAPSGPTNVRLGDVTNVFRLEGAVSSKDVIASIQASSEKVLQQTKREMVGWLDTYNADGAIV